MNSYQRDLDELKKVGKLYFTIKKVHGGLSLGGFIPSPLPPHSEHFLGALHRRQFPTWSGPKHAYGFYSHYDGINSGINPISHKPWLWD